MGRSSALSEHVETEFSPYWCQSVKFDNEQPEGIREHQNRGRGKAGFEGNKGFFGEIGPLKPFLARGELMERGSNEALTLNETLREVCRTLEPL